MSRGLGQLTVRLSGQEDSLALGRLAQLDCTRWDGSPVVLAEAGGELLAALPLHGGRAFADPFRRTAELLELLELRLAQLSVAQQRSGDSARVSLARRAGHRLRRYRAPASA